MSITNIRGITEAFNIWPLRGILKFAGITEPSTLTPVPPVTPSFILMESTGFILLEDGSKILLE